MSGERRIGYVLKKFPRLSETFVLSELLAVEAQGAAVTVLSLRRPDDARFHGELAELGAEVRYVEEFGRASVRRGLRTLGTLDATARSRAVDFADRLGGERGVDVLLQAVEVAAEVRRLDIDHLHAHFATIASHVAYLAHLVTGVPFSVTAHAKDIYRHTIDWSVTGEVLSAAATVVTVCDANAAHLRRLVPEANVRRIYNGMRRARPPEHDPGRREPIVLGVGRLVEKKGFDVLVEAIAELGARGRRTECVIVGDGDERAAIERRVAALGLTDRVRLVGAQPQHVVAEWLRRSRVLVAPCQVGADGNQDALPTVLLEALAAGLPVVSTPVAGIPEIVDHRDHGLIVPERDAAAVADAVETLFDDDALWRALSLAGPRRVDEAVRPGDDGRRAGRGVRGLRAGARPAVRIHQVCADRGIAPGGTKGAARHLASVATALGRSGHQVITYAARRRAGDDHGAEVRPLAELASAERPDAVYERYSLGHDAGLEQARRWRVPFVLEVNAPLVTESLAHRPTTVGPDDATTERRLLAAADLVVCVSEPLRRWVASLRGNSRGTIVLPNGVDPERFRRPRGARRCGAGDRLPRAPEALARSRSADRVARRRPASRVRRPPPRDRRRSRSRRRRRGCARRRDVHPRRGDRARRSDDGGATAERARRGGRAVPPTPRLLLLSHQDRRVPRRRAAHRDHRSGRHPRPGRRRPRWCARPATTARSSPPWSTCSATRTGAASSARPPGRGASAGTRGTSLRVG